MVCFFVAVCETWMVQFCKCNFVNSQNCCVKAAVDVSFRKNVSWWCSKKENSRLTLKCFGGFLLLCRLETQSPICTFGCAADMGLRGYYFFLSSTTFLTLPLFLYVTEASCKKLSCGDAGQDAALPHQASQPEHRHLCGASQGTCFHGDRTH